MHAATGGTFDTVVFSMLYTISTTIDYVHLYVFYICKTIQSSTCCPREKVVVSMQGTAFTIARLKIIPTIWNWYHIAGALN